MQSFVLQREVPSAGPAHMTSDSKRGLTKSPGPVPWAVVRQKRCPMGRIVYFAVSYMVIQAGRGGAAEHRPSPSDSGLLCTGWVG